MDRSTGFTPTGEEVLDPVVDLDLTYASVTERISGFILGPGKPGRRWLVGFTVSFLLFMLLIGTICYLLAIGVGIWGVGIPVAWGFAITNFVWWIGIGHAGTLISAILYLLGQRWRTSINRFAEAMTLFAVACAGLFPLMHLGRPWVFYWLLPYPNTMRLWPQFRSPLVWDVFAVSTYLTISLIFWYVGLVPDLATMRERARSKATRIIFGILALGWRGSTRHWHRYESAYLLLAGLATPLVVSVHTVVSFDFAVAIVPGWNSTIFPPYFVAGAIYSGFAMVMTIAIPLRRYYHLEGYITLRHLDNMAKLMLTTGLVVAYGYLMETFMAWYSQDLFEMYLQHNRLWGPYGWVYWLVLLCNVLAPQALWSRRVRRNVPALFCLSLVVNVGMWMERFMIVVGGLHRDYPVSMWGMFTPTFWDFSTYFGTIGMFVMLLYLFVRFLPMISIAEMKDLLHKVREDHQMGARP